MSLGAANTDDAGKEPTPLFDEIKPALVVFEKKFVGAQQIIVEHGIRGKLVFYRRPLESSGRLVKTTSKKVTSK